jgi:hypothetical protein
MQLTKEQLEALEKMGASFLSIKECAIALEVDEVNFCKIMNDRTSEIFKTYWKGVLNAKVKHVKNVADLSDRGSSPAQQMIQKMIDHLYSKNN